MCQSKATVKQMRDSYSLFLVDDDLSIPVKFFEESMLHVLQIYLSHTKNYWRSFAGIKLGSQLETIHEANA